MGPNSKLNSARSKRSIWQDDLCAVRYRLNHNEFDYEKSAAAALNLNLFFLSSSPISAEAPPRTTV